MYKTLSGTELNGKTILLRIDLNSVVQDGKILFSSRFPAHASTISSLLGQGSKLVLLAHQGRKGDADFIPLDQHFEILKPMIRGHLSFLRFSDFDKLEASVRQLQAGQALLLDNLRFLDFEYEEKTSEEHSAQPFLQNLAKLADFYVNDSLSVCHRSHASVVGFSKLLPSFVGPVLEKELSALAQNEKSEKPRLLFLGGAKPKESLLIVKEMFSKEKIDAAILCGFVGKVCLLAKGLSLGAEDANLEKAGFYPLIPLAKELLEKFPGRIHLPLDLAFDADGKRLELSLDQLPSNFISYDIGEKTIRLFSDSILNAKSIVFNGPPGLFSKPGFDLGTRAIYSAISKSRAFSILGGGDTETAIQKLGFGPEQFGHISLAGKAFLLHLAGKKLPGLLALDPQPT